MSPWPWFRDSLLPALVMGTRAPWPQTQGHLGTTDKGCRTRLRDSGPHALEHGDQGQHCPAADFSLHKTRKQVKKYAPISASVAIFAAKS